MSKDAAAQLAQAAGLPPDTAGSVGSETVRRRPASALVNPLALPQPEVVALE